VAWWPDTIPAGSVTSEIGATIDILPTLAKLAGAEVPKDRTIDGKDISDLLLCKRGAKSPHEVHYYEIDGVRKGKWKLVRIRKKYELYDLDADIGEKRNLASKFPQKLSELKALLDAHKANLAGDNRPAAFVKNPKPLLTDTKGVPTLAEFMGRTDVDIHVGKPRPQKKKQGRR
jgi:arylsulfatase A-like enzyme